MIKNREPQLPRYQPLSINMRALLWSRMESADAYEANIQRSHGFASQSHACHVTQVVSDFIWPGGTVMISFLILPSETAWRCSQMASMCHPGTKRVNGSMMRHAWRVKERREDSALPAFRRERSRRANSISAICPISKSKRVRSDETALIAIRIVVGVGRNSSLRSIGDSAKFFVS